MTASFSNMSTAVDVTKLLSTDHAHLLDKESQTFRDHFITPTLSDLHRDTINPATAPGEDVVCTYLCGNSLGLQPRLTRKYLDEYLSIWAQKGVTGHFRHVHDSHLPPWLNADDDLREDMAKIVGASAEEIAVMQTLTGNLHLMMSSFYRPTKQRYKILIEGKAFPSDHFAVESQIRQHGFDLKDAMVFLEPNSQEDPTITLDHTLQIIDKHAAELALVMLPGIQYYTGQYLDMNTITQHAQAKGIIVGWDLAHAVGNVDLKLHDWHVDFAVWCTYKYLNSGPGSIGGCFVHERHSQVDTDRTGGTPDYRPRLSGWWGSSKESRFNMNNIFEPLPGAAGFQLSNPSVADSTALRASLDVFKQTTMSALRNKSIALTSYLEQCLDALTKLKFETRPVYRIITPRDPAQRGAQISVRFLDGVGLDEIMEFLDKEGVVVDERRPNVIRVAPAPLYNTFSDVRRFVEVLGRALDHAMSS